MVIVPVGALAFSLEGEAKKVLEFKLHLVVLCSMFKLLTKVGPLNNCFPELDLYRSSLSLKPTKVH